LIVYRRAYLFECLLRFAIDVARGVAELHAVDVLCLNLKPSSLFCHENGSIIVGDYGIRSILKEEEDLLTVAPRYAPPEMCTDKTFWPSVEFDSWSFGCILVEMFTGKCL
jgi:E3 ubiquitin-protein ligase KEG